VQGETLTPEPIMTIQRTVLLSCLTALLAACTDPPTGSLVVGDPLFAGVGAPRFTEATGTPPSATSTTGAMSITFKMSGLGSKAGNVVTATATGDAVWACRFGTGEFDAFPAPQAVSQSVNAASAVAMKNGQVSGTMSLNPPANPLVCAVPNRTAVLISTSFDGVQLSHPDAETLPIIGTFNRTFFTLPTETLPILTNVQPEATTMTIGSGLLNYTATIENAGPPLSSVVLQSWVSQGTAWRAAAGSVVNCGGAGGDLPTGTCTDQNYAGVSNATPGNGTLVPGPAVLEIQLRGSPSVRALAGWRINVTLQ
jgi:hypothetical protein